MKPEAIYNLLHIAFRELAKLEKENKLAKSEPFSKEEDGNTCRENDLIPQKEFMTLLGMSRATLWRRRQEGMPFKKIGGKTFYQLAEISAWLDRKNRRNGR